MKRTYIYLSLLLVAFTSCSQQAEVTLTSRINTASATGAPLLRAPVNGTAASITSYQVTFKKVEVGNSEQDKLTLWQSTTDAGVIKDIASEVTFDGVNSVKEGTYKFLRLTIGTDLVISGSIPDGTNTLTGTITNRLSNDTYVWGVADSGVSTTGVLSAPVSLADNSKITLVFNVSNTVQYSNGFTVTAPVISLTAP